jgi:hypothetical protein
MGTFRYRHLLNLVALACACVGPLQGGGIAYGLKRHIFFLRKEKI